eukprot:3311090-Prymnesium_polylepis.1
MPSRWPPRGVVALPCQSRRDELLALARRADAAIRQPASGSARRHDDHAAAVPGDPRAARGVEPRRAPPVP